MGGQPWRPGERRSVGASEASAKKGVVERIFYMASLASTIFRFISEIDSRHRPRGLV